MEKVFTKKEQLEAIQEVVALINKYKLQILVDHQIKVVPFEIEEDKNGKK